MINDELYRFSADVATEPARNPSIHCPWTNGNTYKHADCEKCLHREMIDFAKWLAPSDSERHLRLILINRLRSEVSVLWPEAKLICHGSTATKTNLPDGDLDFVVYNAPSDHSPLAILDELENHLRRTRVLRNSQVINARCPIIKGIDARFGFHVDIAVNNENGILNIERHQNYLKKYPSLFPALMVIKIFLVQHGLDAPFTGGISSNTLMQMVVFIIQSNFKFTEANCGKTLVLFMKCFGDVFNYPAVGITTREGGRVFNRWEFGSLSTKFPVNLCIEDPQNPGVFLGGNASATCEFQKRCHSAAIALVRKSIIGEQSIILRIIHTSTTQRIQSKKKELDMHYKILCGMDRMSFVEEPEHPQERKLRPNEVRVLPFSR